MTILSFGRWRAEFANDTPVLLRLSDTIGGGELLGDAAGAIPILQVCKIGEATEWAGDMLSDFSAVTCEPLGGAAWRVYTTWSKSPACAFTLRYELREDSLVATWGEVREEPGFLLLQIRLPLLAALTVTSAARIVHPLSGGREAVPDEVADAEQETHPGANFPMQTAMVHDDRILAVLRCPSLDDNLRVAVAPHGRITPFGHRVAMAPCLRGMDKVALWRDLASALPGGPRVAALSATVRHRPPPPDVLKPRLARPDLSFIVQSGSQVEILLVPASPDRPLDWFAGAERLRRDVASRPSGRFGDGLRWNAQITLAGDPRWFAYTPTGHGFAHVLDTVRRIHHLTDGLPQRPRIYGWQHRGHDTGYPDTLSANAAAGGSDAFHRLFAEARELNACVYVHDNYLDGYAHGLGFDVAALARDESGEIMRGWVWDGGQSYMHGSANYARNFAAVRLKANRTTWPFFDAVYIDILNDYFGRYDYHPGHPASLEAEFAGKAAIVVMHQQAGLAVESECWHERFAGVLDHQQAIRADNGWIKACFSIEREIPLASAVYHGHDSFAYSCTAGPDDRVPSDMLRALRQGLDTEMRDQIGTVRSVADAIDSMYLHALPVRLLERREVTAANCGPSRWILHFGPDPAGSPWPGADPTAGAEVEVDLQTRTYRITVAGRIIAQNFTTFCPGRDGAWLAYARHGGEHHFAPPSGWSAVTACELLDVGRGPEMAVNCDGGDLLMSLRPGVPLRLWCNRRVEPNQPAESQDITERKYQNAPN